MQKDKDKVLGALLGVAVGDALGAPLEFMSVEEIRVQHGGEVREMIGGGWLNVEPGEITDDTQMTLELAAGIAEYPERPIPAIGRRFILWYQSKPKDIGSACRLAISKAISKCDDQGLGDITDWYNAAKEADKILGGKSAGNGALMRTVYPALFYNSDEWRDRITEQAARITHWNDESAEACVLYNRIIDSLIQGGDKQSAAQILTGTRYENRPDKLQPTGYVVHSMECALSCFFDTTTFEAAVIKAVNLGGDADTIGAITGCLVGALYGVGAIPIRWTDKIALPVRALIDRLSVAAGDNIEY